MTRKLCLIVLLVASLLGLAGCASDGSIPTQHASRDAADQADQRLRQFGMDY